MSGRRIYKANMKSPLSFLLLLVALMTSVIARDSDDLPDDEEELVKIATHFQKQISMHELELRDDDEIDGPIDLDSRNFNQNVWDGSVWLIEFHAPW